MSAFASLIEEARGFLGLNAQEVKRILGAAATTESADEYRNMKNVTSMENRQVFPGTIFLQGATVELVYIASPGLAPFREGDLYAQFGTDAVRLRSRAGKHANLLVFAEQGIACSTGQEGLDFLEVFRPRTRQEYKEQIYRDPGPFIR